MASTPLPKNQAAFTPEEILGATGAELLAPSERPLRGVCTDSRAVESGNLFVALRGVRHDGHAHIDQALERGAHAMLVDRDVAAPAGVGVFRVEDTLSALGALAALHRRRFDIPVVAITGSVGKTSTKELVAAALAETGRVPAYTRGNLNNRIGVPMTLFTLGPEHDAAVVELGMNVPGEIALLTAMAAPTIGVVTSVAEAHTEGVGGIEGVAREKGALLTGLGQGASAIWNADEARLAEYAARSPAARKMSYGQREGADVRLIRWELDGHGGTLARYDVLGRAIEVNLAMLGEAAAVNAAAALAVVGAIDEAQLERAAGALGAIAPSLHRMVPTELPSGLLVLDDTYNASPRATIAALETAAVLAATRGGVLIAVLGDMYELGAEAERLHTDIGREVVRAGARVLIACGALMAHAGRAAAARSATGARIEVVLLQGPESAADCVRELAGERDVVLVKGSRGMRMERVVEALSSSASSEAAR